MFTCEDGAMERLNIVLDQYEIKFDQEFPLYEYLATTAGNGYDFSVEGCNKLADFIERLTGPVLVPEGYFDRVY